jgi:hypothetical protein
VLPEHGPGDARGVQRSVEDRRRHGGERGALEAPVVVERVGPVGLPHRLVAGEDRGVDGDLGQRVERQQGGRAGVAHQRGGDDEAGQAVAVALGVAHGDQAAHRVAHEHEWQAGVRGARAFDQQVQVVDDRVEVGDESGLAVRAPVPDVVEAVDGGAVLAQGRGDVVVAADVLAVAVRDHHDVARLLVVPRAHVDGSGVTGQGNVVARGSRRRRHGGGACHERARVGCRGHVGGGSRTRHAAALVGACCALVTAAPAGRGAGPVQRLALGRRMGRVALARRRARLRRPDAADGRHAARRRAAGARTAVEPLRDGARDLRRGSPGAPEVWRGPGGWHVAARDVRRAAGGHDRARRGRRLDPVGIRFRAFQQLAVSLFTRAQTGRRRRTSWPPSPRPTSPAGITPATAAATHSARRRRAGRS